MNFMDTGMWIMAFSGMGVAFLVMWLERRKQ